MTSLRTWFLHITALNAFAIAQPVFDRLGSNPEYLRLEGYSKLAIAAALLIYLLTIPLITGGILAGLRWLKCPKAAGWVFATVGTLLVTLVINLALRWIHWRFDLRSADITDSIFAGLSLPLAIGCAWLYRRFEWSRQLLSIAAIGVVLFPLNLLSTPAMRAELLGDSPKKVTGARAENPVPIVFIAFDGLCAMSLLDETHEIDAVRYPSFARLGQQSQFYRNATSVHCRTTQAVPAILTGQLPDEAKLSPVESNHPQNLFRLIHDTGAYDMTVFEPLTRLCPTELRKFDQKQSFSEQIAELTQILGLVYIATTAPSDVDFLQLQIPRVWFGFVPDEAGKQQAAKGLITYAWDSEHDLQVDHFAQSLVKTDKPGFHFLHVVIPHDPWSRLPSGKKYIKRSKINEPTVGAFGELGELWGSDELMVQYGWQRYLLQLQYADRCLGQIIDRLESIGEFDRTLMVVVADHGMAFVPGQERRIPTNSTVADLMSVPLFIKQPGQADGQISDLNVETIDVLPTIADIIQLPLLEAVDGESLHSGNYHERPRKIMESGGEQTIVVNPEFSERFGYIDRMQAVFGTGSEDRLWNLNTIPELVGREIANCEIGSASQWKCELANGGEGLDSRVPDFIPCYFVGSLKGPVISTPVQIAISLNGRIECTTRTSVNPSRTRQWTALLREELIHPDINEIALFEVERVNNSFVLHPIPN